MLKKVTKDAATSAGIINASGSLTVTGTIGSTKEWTLHSVSAGSKVISFGDGMAISSFNFSGNSASSLLFDGANKPFSGGSGNLAKTAPIESLNIGDTTKAEELSFDEVASVEVDDNARKSDDDSPLEGLKMDEEPIATGVSGVISNGGSSSHCGMLAITGGANQVTIASQIGSNSSALSSVTLASGVNAAFSSAVYANALTTGHGTTSFNVNVTAASKGFSEGASGYVAADDGNDADSEHSVVESIIVDEDDALIYARQNVASDVAPDINLTVGEVKVADTRPITGATLFFGAGSSMNFNSTTTGVAMYSGHGVYHDHVSDVALIATAQGIIAETTEVLGQAIAEDDGGGFLVTPCTIRARDQNLWWFLVSCLTKMEKNYA